MHWQNIQLYTFGVLANVAALNLNSASSLSSGPGFWADPFEGFNAGAWLSVLGLALVGLAVSFLLRFADSIVKTFATVLTPPFSAVAAWFILGDPCGPELVLGVTTMMLSMVFFFGEATLFRDPSAAAAEEGEKNGGKGGTRV